MICAYFSNNIASALRNKFQEILLDANFDSIRNSLIPFENGDLMRIPTVSELFGQPHCFEPDNAEQWILMKGAANKAALRMDGKHGSGWLQNKVLDSTMHFAYINSSGFLDYAGAPCLLEIRPVFALKNTLKGAVL